MELIQEEKAARLQWAVINSSDGELSKECDALGYVEMAAPALGLACRFRGLDAVKILAEKGITFDFPSTGEIEAKYRCYIGQKYANYRTNYSLYLLKIFRGGLKGACSTKGMKFTQNAKRDTGKPLSFLADEERVRVLAYLMQNREKLLFQPEEMLFYAIYAKDTIIYEALKKYGVTLLDRRVQTITEGGIATDGYWHEYGSMTGKLADEEYLEVMQQLAAELEGKPFYYTEKMLDITRHRFRDSRIFEYFLANFRQDKMKKYQIIRNLIDEGALDALPVIEREGWLQAPNKRDEMIEYASRNSKTEALAWLLDFKNRTADLAAEAKKAEKKLLRELAADPNSLTQLKSNWRYEKKRDGTLIITGYKGKSTILSIPEMIGEDMVTEIDSWALATAAHGIKEPTRRFRETITKIVLPNSIRVIGSSAFRGLLSLQELVIQPGVKKIGQNAFSDCWRLKSILIPEGVTVLEDNVFSCYQNTSELESVVLPSTLDIFSANRKSFPPAPNLFWNCPKVTVRIPPMSKARQYCEKHRLKYEHYDIGEIRKWYQDRAATPAKKQ